MKPVGDILRSEREKQGRTIAGIAEELCIMQGYVRALENGDLEALPGLFFYKSFTRQYAAILGLDEKLIASHLATLATAEEPAAAASGVRVPDPMVVKAARLHLPDVPLHWSVSGLVAVLTIGSAIYTWWNQPAAATAPRVRVEQQAPADTAQKKDVALKTEDGDATSGVVLRLSATERTWLSISSGGHEIFSGILQPSESKTLRGLDMATMKVGNAGGISVRWNGKPIGPLGSSGQVLTVRFTPEDFEIVPPAPKQEL